MVTVIGSGPGTPRAASPGTATTADSRTGGLAGNASTTADTVTSPVTGSGAAICGRSWAASRFIAARSWPRHTATSGSRADSMPSSSTEPSP
jgi:hypothetical protein